MTSRPSPPPPPEPVHTEDDERDRRLVGRVAAGDATAFDELAGRYRPRLLAIAARFVDDAAAEDAVQNTLVRAFQCFTAGQIPTSPWAWLATSCRHAAIDQIRRRGPVAPSDTSDRGGAEPPAEQVAEARARLRRVLGAVADLPAAEREALLLRATEGAGHAEIGEALGVSSGQARQLLHRARLRLREVAAVLLPAWLALRVAQARASTGSPGTRLAAPGGAMAAIVCVGALYGGGVALHPRTGGARDDTHSTPAQQQRTTSGGTTAKLSAGASTDRAAPRHAAVHRQHDAVANTETASARVAPSTADAATGPARVPAPTSTAEARSGADSPGSTGAADGNKRTSNGAASQSIAAQPAQTEGEGESADAPEPSTHETEAEPEVGDAEAQDGEPSAVAQPDETDQPEPPEAADDGRSSDGE